MTRRHLAAAHRALGRHHEADLEERASQELVEQIRNSSTRTQHPSEGPELDDQPERFLREGDYWTVHFDGRIIRVKDLKGIRYLARLLTAPAQEFHVLDLIAAEHLRHPDTREPSHSDGLESTLGDAGEILDAQARTAYRRRLEEIDHDMDDARASGDLGRVQQAEVERDFLVRELSNAFGIGGRSRKAGAASERARVAVTRALRTAIRHIGDHHKALGEHLDHAVRTGTYCSYQPDPARPSHWQV